MYRGIQTHLPVRGRKLKNLKNSHYLRKSFGIQTHLPVRGRKRQRKSHNYYDSHGIQTHLPVRGRKPVKVFIVPS